VTAIVGGFLVKREAHVDAEIVIENKKVECD